METMEVIAIGVVVFIVFAALVCWCICHEENREFHFVDSELVDVDSGYSRLDDDYYYTNEFSGGKKHTEGILNVEFMNESNGTPYTKRKNVCEYCSKKFGRLSSLESHHRDTHFANCRVRKYTQLSLSDNVKIDVNRRCKQASLDQNMYPQCKNLVIDVLTNLLEHRSNNGRFSKTPDQEGSTKTGLKTRKAVEFDFSVKINLRNIPKLVSRSDSEHEDNCMTEMYLFDVTGEDDEKIPADCAEIILGPQDIWRFEDCCNNEGVLSPTKLRLNFHNFLLNAAKKVSINGVKTIVCAEPNGPAVKLLLKAKPRGINHDINIDLSPKVVLPDYVDPKTFAQGFDWPRYGTNRFLTDEDIQFVEQKGLYLVPKKDKYWSLSFANYENAVLQLFSNTSTEKNIIRNMKVKLEKWQSQSPAELKAISSYLLKETFFWLREKMPQKKFWTGDKCAERYYNFVEELKFCFQHRQLHNYFVPSTNLLEGKEKACSAMLRYLDEELKKII